MSNQQYDAIVVGSGISGGWAAKELTEKGIEAKKMHDEFHQDMIRSVIDSLNGDEERILTEALKKLIQFFQEKYH